MKFLLKKLHQTFKKKDYCKRVVTPYGVFYQPHDQDYNGLFRLFTDINQTNNDVSSIKEYFIVQGGITAIGDESLLFGRYDFEHIPCKNILIDMSTEAINLTLSNDFYVENLQKMVGILTQDKYKSYHFTLVHANTALKKAFEEILDQHHITAPNLAFKSMDFYLARFYYDIRSTSVFQALLQLLDETEHHLSEEKNTITYA